MAVVGLLVLAVALTIGFLQSPTDWRRSRPILSTYVVVLVGFALYIVFPSVLIMVSGSYTWAPSYYSESAFAKVIWLSILSLAAFYYGNALGRTKLAKRTTSSVSQQSAPDNDLQSRTTEILLWMLLTVGIILKIFLIVKTGGLADSVSRLNSYARQFSGIDELDAGSIQLRTLSGVADGAATWGLIRALKLRVNEKLWLAILLGTLSLSYLTIGKRLILLLPIFCVLVAIHVYRRPLTTRLLPIVLAVAMSAGFVTLMIRIFLPASVQGYNINLNNIAYANGSIIQFYLYSLEFSSVEMISVAMASKNEIIDMFGGTWNAFFSTNIESFFYSIPRAVWPGKPPIFYDISHGISAALGATSFDDPTVGYASTVIGTSYLLGGVAAVILSMFFFGVITARLDARLSHSNWSYGSIVIYAISIVATFHLFRQGTLGWTFIVSVVQQYGAIAALLVLSMSAKRSRETSPSMNELASQR